MTGNLGKRAFAVLAAGAVLLASAVVPAGAAGAPTIVESWVTDVTATGANLRAVVNPNGLSTSYRFEYITEAAYQANLDAIPPREGFFGAAKAPAGKEAGLGSGTTPLGVVQHIGGLSPATSYRFRPVATNSAGSATGPEHILATQETSLVFKLPDSRAWELVSPADKGGGAIASPETLFGGGDFQAAETSSATGAAIAYGSSTSFGDAEGAPPASQYVSRRTASGWSTENVSAPLESAAYGDKPDGVPYRVFSSDLARAILFGGLACRGDLPGCPSPNPVLPGTGAPPGFMAYYMRDNASGGFGSLLDEGDFVHTAVGPEAFEVSFAAASPDLSRVVLSSCAALTADAKETLTGPGECDPKAQNLYEWSAAGLELVNVLPGDTDGTPGAQIAAPIGAVSVDGARVYWAHGGNLYLREGSQTVRADGAMGGTGTFQTASADGGVAFFLEKDHLRRFLVATKASEDLTPGGGVVGVLGASADGSSIYYQDAGALMRWHEDTTAEVAAGASATLPSDYPPPTATARVSPGGEHLAFLSKAELTPFDNAGATEVYLYGPPVGGGEPQLICASCNPTGERAQGSSTIPGAPANGSARAYRPRALSISGARLFFTSADELVVQDTNSHPDVYQWEAKGSGDCQRSPGCVNLISSGRALDGATFIDATANGSDVFFTTDESLLPNADPAGSIDLYDARIGGGLPEPLKKIPCVADACQSLPAPPDDPTPGTLVKNPGNPPLRVFKEKKRRHPKKHRRRHRNHRHMGGRGR